eukprot:TRINITY_DN13570_c0_g1_i1.p1 TRINITY_DN13570_c0_g1~~TRINITY_DN13570_c0_g1_i1.p1  ORF type:complete len:73 (+),score=7.95 TRINITY_DN13570_c0_g1_i1:110-328(+)
MCTLRTCGWWSSCCMLSTVCFVQKQNYDTQPCQSVQDIMIHTRTPPDITHTTPMFSHMTNSIKLFDKEKYIV